MAEIGSHVVFITDDAIGEQGELGQALLRSFVAHLREVAPRPSHLLFMNRGVHLVCDEGPTLEYLKALEVEGVVLLACGTCLDFFDKTDRIKAGQASNMAEILGAMTAASKVIRP